MSDRSKYLDTVLKLNRLTQDGRIEWKRRAHEVHEGLADLSPTLEEYVTEQKGKRFVLYQAPDTRETAFDFGWAERMAGGNLVRAVLEIRDEAGETLFTFPHMAAVNDLYETVYTGRSNEVEAFLEEFLSEE